MDKPFPFGFPPPTAFYLSLYIASWVVHVAFMHYVLAGTAYLVGAGLAGFIQGGARAESLVTRTLRDWMPFAVSMAITAGVAPLIFLQILYQRQFYTANLLLFDRWMAILPALIVGFYLTYLLKAVRTESWPAAARLLIAIGAFLCFAFTGATWSTNHVVSLKAGEWACFYESGVLVSGVPRVFIWFASSFGTLAWLVGWQLFALQRRALVVPVGIVGRLAALGLASVACTALAVGMYYLYADSRTQAAIVGPLALPYLLAFIGGLLIQAVFWLAALRARRLGALCLWVASAGGLLSLLGVAVMREAVRLRDVDVNGLFARHADARSVGGLTVFVTFAVINALLIAWGFRLVLRGLRRHSLGAASRVL